MLCSFWTGRAVQPYYWRVDSFVLVSSFSIFGETWSSSKISRAKIINNVLNGEGPSWNLTMSFMWQAKKTWSNAELTVGKWAWSWSSLHWVIPLKHIQKWNHGNHIYLQPEKKISLMQLILETRQKGLSSMMLQNTGINAIELPPECLWVILIDMISFWSLLNFRCICDSAEQ